MVPGNNRQTYDLTLVVQTETIIFFIGNKIKFCSAVVIFGFRSMVIGNTENKNIGIGPKKPYRSSSTYKTQSNSASSVVPLTI